MVVLRAGQHRGRVQQPGAGRVGQRPVARRAAGPAIPGPRRCGCRLRQNRHSPSADPGDGRLVRAGRRDTSSARPKAARRFWYSRSTRPAHAALLRPDQLLRRPARRRPAKYPACRRVTAPASAACASRSTAYARMVSSIGSARVARRRRSRRAAGSFDQDRASRFGQVGPVAVRSSVRVDRLRQRGDRVEPEAAGEHAEPDEQRPARPGRAGRRSSRWRRAGSAAGRAGRAARRPAGRGARSSWSSISAGDSVSQRAAASSIASGRPSSRWHSSTDRGQVRRRSSAKPYAAAWARALNSASAGEPASAGLSAVRARLAASRGRAGPAAAPGRPARRRGRAARGWTTSTVTPGRRRAARLTSGAATSTCSKLSSTSSSDRSARCSVTVSGERLAGHLGDLERLGERGDDQRRGRRPRPAARTPPRRRTPSATAPATASASRVLPMPPGPTSVTSRRSASSCGHLGGLLLPADQLGHRHRAGGTAAGRLGQHAPGPASRRRAGRGPARRCPAAGPAPGPARAGSPPLRPASQSTSAGLGSPCRVVRSQIRSAAGDQRQQLDGVEHGERRAPGRFSPGPVGRERRRRPCRAPGRSASCRRAWRRRDGVLPVGEHDEHAEAVGRRVGAGREPPARPRRSRAAGRPGRPPPGTGCARRPARPRPAARRALGRSARVRKSCAAASGDVALQQPRGRRPGARSRRRRRPRSPAALLGQVVAPVRAASSASASVASSGKTPRRG